MALHCPQAIAADELSLTRMDDSRASGAETMSVHRPSGSMNQSLMPHIVTDGADLERRAGREAPVLVVTDLAEANAAPAPAYPPDTMVTGTYVPGPVEVGWQIYVGSAVAAFPFVLGAYEFGKRILIQRRCEKCGGNGLVKKGKFYRKCSECGGFFPWQGWKLFFTSTASPGNGGPLLQPRGQTSVLYKVPPKPNNSLEEEVAAKASTTSKSGDSLSGDGDGTKGAEAGIEAALVSRLTAATRVVVLDAVTSNSAVALPLPRLIQACRERAPGVLVLVDAAHALGQQDLSIAGLDADFVAANCHKWLGGPRGSAVLWAAQRHHARLRPLVVSHGHGHGFTSDFIWDGNRDYAPYLAVGGALAWWRAHGHEAREYMRATLRAAAHALQERWGSGLLAPLRLCGAMACVALPAALQSSPPGAADSADAKELQEALYRSGVEVPVKVHAGRLYVRISAHVYNAPADYAALAAAVDDLVATASGGPAQA